MNEVAHTGIEQSKRTDTAELRRRFDRVNELLIDGYNHKQICEYLNSEGLGIPYPQYRAIMTRLRRERSQSMSPGKSTGLRAEITCSESKPSSPAPIKHVVVSAPDQGAGEKKLSWNPGSEVKWK